MVLFLVIYLIAVIFDTIDSISLKYQMLERYDFLQFYMNNYHKQRFGEKLSFFWLYIYLLKVKYKYKLEFTSNMFYFCDLPSWIWKNFKSYGLLPSNLFDILFHFLPILYFWKSQSR